MPLKARHAKALIPKSTSLKKPRGHASTPLGARAGKLSITSEKTQLRNGAVSVQVNAYKVPAKGLEHLVGSAVFTKRGAKLYPESVHVFKEYRGQGIGTRLYKAAAKYGNIVAGETQTRAGKAFSAKVRGGKH